MVFAACPWHNAVPYCLCARVCVAGPVPAAECPVWPRARGVGVALTRACGRGQSAAWEDVDDSLVVTQDVQDLWRAVVEDEIGPPPIRACMPLCALVRAPGSLCRTAEALTAASHDRNRRAGDIYYWNTVTDETSWERPRELLRVSTSRDTRQLALRSIKGDVTRFPAAGACTHPNPAAMLLMLRLTYVPRAVNARYLGRAGPRVGALAAACARPLCRDAGHERWGGRHPGRASRVPRLLRTRLPGHGVHVACAVRAHGRAGPYRQVCATYTACDTSHYRSVVLDGGELRGTSVWRGIAGADRRRARRRRQRILGRARLQPCASAARGCIARWHIKLLVGRRRGIAAAAPH